MQTIPGGKRTYATRQFSRYTLLLTLLWAAVSIASTRSTAAPTADWPVIPKEELEETAPKIASDAPAEILSYRVDLDDSEYPEIRIVHEYTRAKIYKPEQIEALTRVSGRELSDSRFEFRTTVNLRARLTLPDGTVKTFGDDAIRERTLSKTREGNFVDRLLGNSGPEVKERFLAIAGVEKGAILETKIDRRTRSGGGAAATSMTVLQRRQLPIRFVEATIHAPPQYDWNYQYFVLNKNAGNATMKDDEKHRTLVLTATDLPALINEPMSGLSSTYYALSLIGCYEKRERNTISRHRPVSYHVDPKKTGPWSIVAVPFFMTLEDYQENTSRIRNITTDLTASTNDPLEKARRIHEYIGSLYANYVREFRFNKTEASLGTFSTSLSDAIDYSRKSPFFNIRTEDYLALALSMYKIAGLETRVILLPDRRVVPFSPALVSRTFLPNPAISIKINGNWVLSTPTVLPTLPLGEVPWYCEGQIGLVVKEGPQEFVEIPHSESSKTLIGNAGSFVLNPDGSLEGTAKRKYTGQSAFTIRQMLLNRDPSRQRGYLARLISREFKLPLKRASDVSADDSEEEDISETGAVRITRMSGLEGIGKPIEIEYHVRIPEFAAVTDQRLIFRPWVFRANTSNPFVSETRLTDVHFPYAVQELDVETIKLPPGYTPQFSDATPPSSGAALHFKPSITFDAENHQLKLRREYAANLVKVPVKIYPELKAWFDASSRVDQQEVVATLSPKGTEPTSSPAANGNVSSGAAEKSQGPAASGAL